MAKLYHISKKKELFIYNNNVIKKDLPEIFCIEKGSYQALQFVMSYCTYYEEKAELPSVEYPLHCKVPLSDLFHEEIEIFGFLLIINSGLNYIDENVAKMRLLVDILQITEILELAILMDKISAIINYYITHLPVEEMVELAKLL